MSTSHTETLYRRLRERDQVAVADLRAELNSLLPGAIQCLQRREDVTIYRLEADGAVIPAEASARYKGVKTAYLTMDVTAEEPLRFRGGWDRHNGTPGRTLQELLDDIRGRDTGFRTPCRLPLEEMPICHHGSQCANSHKCPVARQVQPLRKYEDERVAVRKQLEKAGWKQGWTFTIRDVFGHVSEGGTE